MADDEEGHKKMEEMVEKGEVDGAVTMHFPFPIGVSTVGRVITPAKGKEMFVANTTGTSSADRIEGMIKNAVYGIIAAKACGVKEPTLGILNVDGARQTEMALKELQKNGYDFKFAESARADGGAVMRGNDVLQGTPDVMVMDSLTGNVMVKMLSSFTTGGSFEASGYGYGPGIGEGYDKLIMIVSRASGAPGNSQRIGIRRAAHPGQGIRCCQGGVCQGRKGRPVQDTGRPQGGRQARGRGRDGDRSPRGALHSLYPRHRGHGP